MAHKRIAQLFIAASVFTFSACSVEGPEQRLRETLAAMEASIEAREPGGFLRHVADDFSGGAERLDRQQLRSYLASLLVGRQTVEVVLGVPEIRIHGERATVEVDALVVGGRLLPERGERLRIVSGWREEGGAWRCYSATWTRGGD